MIFEPLATTTTTTTTPKPKPSVCWKNGKSPCVNGACLVNNAANSYSCFVTKDTQVNKVK